MAWWPAAPEMLRVGEGFLPAVREVAASHEELRDNLQQLAVTVPPILHVLADKHGLEKASAITAGVFTTGAGVLTGTLAVAAGPIGLAAAAGTACVTVLSGALGVSLALDARSTKTLLDVAHVRLEASVQAFITAVNEMATCYARMMDDLQDALDDAGSMVLSGSSAHYAFYRLHASRLSEACRDALAGVRASKGHFTLPKPA